MRTFTRLLAFCLAGLAAAHTVAAQTPITAAVQGPTIPDGYGPRTVTPAIIACTNLPTAVNTTATLRIIAPHSPDPNETASRGDLVVLNAGTPQGLMVGQRYFARRILPPLSREQMRAEDRGSIVTSGWLTVVAADQNSALARVDYACTTVQSGDYLEPYTEPTLPAAARDDGRTNFSDLRRVLSGRDRREQFGAGDFLSIDRGSNHGVVGGARVAFYRDRRNGTPLVELGVGTVVEVSAEVSKVILDRSSNAVKSGDYYGFRTVP
jgi:hypothetical protein